MVLEQTLPLSSLIDVLFVVKMSCQLKNIYIHTYIYIYIYTYIYAYMYVSISEGLFQMHFEKRTINLIKFGFT